MRWTLLKKLHQCKQTSYLNDLKNFNNYIDINKINSQLERAELKKRILTRNLYKEYELYLNLVRDLVCISVEKGINQIYSCLLYTSPSPRDMPRSRMPSSA